LVLGSDGVVSEIPLYIDVFSNLSGKNIEKQYLVGSFSGALSFRMGNDCKIISYLESMAPHEVHSKKINKGDHIVKAI
jgi:hypothetical protein